MTETIREKEYQALKPEFIENGMKLSRVREILNNLIAVTVALYENLPFEEVKELASQLAELKDAESALSKRLDEFATKTNSGISSIHEDIGKLEARVAALEKPQL